VVRVKRVRAVVRGSLVQVGGGGGGIDGIIIEEGGVQVAADVTTLNVTGDVTATDDGGGVVTLNVTGGGIAGVILEEGGVQVATDVTTINITGEATVTDDGGGVVTVDVTGAGNGSTGPVHTVPLASAFSTTVGTGITLTDTTAALILRATGHGASFDVQLAVQSAPSSPWVRYFRFEMNPVQKQYLYGGFAIRRSSSGAFVLWSLIHTGTALELQYSEYSSPTARASFTTGIATDATAVYFKIEDDGTNFILSASPGGEAGTYVVVHSVSRTAYLADYNQIGFAADAFNGSSPDRDCILAIQHYGSAAPTYAAGSANGVGGTTDHASLTSLGWTQSGHTGTASTVVGFDGSGAAVTRAAGTTGLALLEDATQGDARTTLGLVPGTDVQAYDAGLASLAGVDTAADLVPYTTAAATWAATTLTSYIRGLLDDVDAATARGTLSAISGWTVTVDVQSGTSGTYTAPAGAVVAIVDLWGGSGGGGGGARQDAATTCTGGASGQAGEWLRWVDSPAAINGLSWSGGAGGSGGAGRTGSTGAGIAGGAGSDSTFAGRVAGGGSSGGGGSATGASLGGGCGTTGAPTATATRTAYRTGTAGLLPPQPRNAALTLRAAVARLVVMAGRCRPRQLAPVVTVARRVRRLVVRGAQTPVRLAAMAPRHQVLGCQVRLAAAVVPIRRGRAARRARQVADVVALVEARAALVTGQTGLPARTVDAASARFASRRRRRRGDARGTGAGRGRGGHHRWRARGWCGRLVCRRRDLGWPPLDTAV
jgi:hypothetical protein